MIDHSLKKRYIFVNAILFLIIIAVALLVFSVDTNGEFHFLTALDKQKNNSAYLAIGMGGIACFIVAISLNVSGEAIQSTTRNALSSPFTLGFTSSITLAYVISSFFNKFPLYASALLALLIIFVTNILPIFFLSNSKYKANKDVFILYGLSITIFFSSIITLLTYFTKPVDFNVLGWMIIEVVTFTTEKYIVGSIFFGIGFTIFLLIVKKIHIIENSYFKASTLGINVNLLNMLSMISVSFMTVGGFVAYAPFTLLGFAIPFITKCYLIKQHDIRLSILPSSLLSVVIVLIAYFINLFLQIQTDVVMIVIMSPFILIMIFERRRNYVFG